MKISEIIFEEIPGEKGNLGLITLNRPTALNALNHAMFLALDEQLAEWAINPSIKAVMIRAVEGRAFCAGGDIKAIYELKKKGDTRLDHFFRDEYRMNSRIHHFPKPYIALLNGITMGGGVGISIHGSHRVGTPNLVFAMPETTIGFYPDVGTTYYLSRFSHRLGYYLGLTGARINCSDALAMGIIQEIVSPESFPEIINRLTNAEITNKNDVTKILADFSTPTSEPVLLQHQNEIAHSFNKITVEEILMALSAHKNEWCDTTAALLKTKSPTSLKVTNMALQKAANLDFDSCIQMEYGLTCHFVEEHDFFEGIRALVIDKDQNPRWQPASLGAVSDDLVKNYFHMKSLA